MNLSPILAKALALAEAHVTVIIGALASAIVWVAGSAHVVLSKPTVTSVLAPLVTSVLIHAHTLLETKKSKPAPAAPIANPVIPEKPAPAEPTK